MVLDFRPLRADEIDVRVGTVGKKGVSMLLYKNARVDMTILDETVGPLNWQREHLRENANCIVSIWYEDTKQWVKKEDTGTESFTEAAKGLASDSFKRACTNWGIGRELYESPFIFFPCATQERQNGKGYVMKNPYEFSGIRVGEIEYAELDKKRIVSKLVLVLNGKEVFRWTLADKDNPVMSYKAPEEPKQEKTLQAELTEAMETVVSSVEKTAWVKRIKDLGLNPTAIVKQAGWESGPLTKDILGKAEVIVKEILDEKRSAEQ